MQNIGALQESLTVVNSDQQTLKAKIKKVRLQSLPENRRIRNSTRPPVERSTRLGQRGKRCALGILSVAAASRSSLLKKIVGRRVND